MSCFNAELGPLPERYDVVTRLDDQGRVHSVRVWSAADMCAYAAAAAAAAVAEERERCATVCEEVEAQAWALWKTTADPTEQGRSIGAQHCADAIRA